MPGRRCGSGTHAPPHVQIRRTSWSSAAVFALLIAAQPASGQTASSVGAWAAIPAESGAPQAGAVVAQVIPDAVVHEPASATKRGEFVIAPIPMINPTLDNGLAMVVGYLYRLDQSDMTTPPSLTLGMIFKTSNGSSGGGAVQQLHLDHDRYRILVAAGYGSLNYDYFGTGSEAGGSGISIPLTQEGGMGLAEGLVDVGAQWYVGGRYQLMDMRVAIDEPQPASGAPVIPAGDVKLRTAALGPRVQRDTRDNPFYPTRGIVANAMAAFYGESLGGRRSYQSYEAWFSNYVSGGSRQVVAWRIAACATANDVPFYDNCQLGKSQDLRGYVVGQYRDRVMIAGQVEYRAEVWRRVGATAFIGGGEVAPTFARLTWQDALPGGGLGLRYTLAKRNHVNLRADYAWGQSSHALYISVGEAF